MGNAVAHFFASWNWVDSLILFTLIIFMVQAWYMGVWNSIANFFTFTTSLILAMLLYPYLAAFISRFAQWGEGTSRAVGFLISSLLLEIFFGTAFGLLLVKYGFTGPQSKRLRSLSIIPALGQGLILISFMLVLFISLPVLPGIKKDIASSRIGGWMISQTTGLEQSLTTIFGGVIEESLTYRITKPDSDESIPLDIEVLSLSIDEAAERELIDLVNEERAKNGLNILEYDPNLTEVGRLHSRDMWERKYFSHYSPEGEDVGDRLADNNYVYLLAGENLALAPTVKTAHIGLMNSPGHRENILREGFNKIGIGVIDNSYYGKMFTQVFSD